jgi:hypothetical protein
MIKIIPAALLFTTLVTLSGLTSCTIKEPTPPPTSPIQPGPTSIELTLQPDGRVKDVVFLDSVSTKDQERLRNNLMKNFRAPPDKAGKTKTMILRVQPSRPRRPIRPAKSLTLTEYEKLTAQLASYEKQGRIIVPARCVHIRPPYPPQGFHKGTVKVHLIINEKGDVDQMLVTGENAEIFLPGIEAVRSDWQFKPGTVDGKPHPFPFIMPVRFELRPY